MIVVLMGVSGAGKTTLGNALATSRGCDFLDADDWHPPANVAKMAAGEPLSDDDRSPWLDRLNAELRAREARGQDTVLACSALKEKYREQLTRGLARVELVFLHGSAELIRERLATRQHHYMPATLLESQFRALEPPQHAIHVDVALSPEQCVALISASLGK
ncbi:MAG TPA: gluconokinase [Burkholderiales bacterium]|nr:gluconokinase [Burkholderiales bacterium]